MNNNRITSIISILLLILLITGCSGTSGLKDKLYTGSDFNIRALPSEDVPVISNQRFELYLYDDMSVSVKDLQTGLLWDTRTKAIYEESFSEDQFVLRYYDSAGSLLQMTSKKDSVDKGQANAYLKHDALYVKYMLGDYEKTLDDVPQVLSNERYMDKFIDKLELLGQDELNEYYKYYESDDIWRIKPKGKNNYKDVLRIMSDVGYTDEDLIQDKIEFGLPTEATSKAFFTIVLKYSFSEDSLEVSLPSEYIEFSSDYPPYEIGLLESFGQKIQGADGYIFIPDGSGALMEFSDGSTETGEISLPVFGLDLSQTSYVLEDNKQNLKKVMMPVFGMKDGKAVYLARITGGESKATINAYKAGDNRQRNCVFTTFRLIDKDRVYLGGNDEHSAKVLIFENKLFDEDCCVEYHFLVENSGYVDMAVKYRELLIEEGSLPESTTLSKGNVPLLIDTINGVKGYKNFLGVSYIGVINLTSYSQVKEMMKDIVDGGITSVDFKLTGWFNGGYYHKFINDIKLNRVSGGRNEWEEMISYANDNGIDIYPDVEFQTFAKGNIFYIPLKDSARKLDYSSVQTPVLSLAMQAENYGNGLAPSVLNVRSPSKLLEITEKFMSKYTSLGVSGISLRSSGNSIYSDFNEKNAVDRTESQDALIKHLEEVKSKSENVMVKECFEYGFEFIDSITDVPLKSSDFSVSNDNIPFLQIVLHGSRNLFGEPMNLVANYNEYLLKSIEYGVYLNYQLTSSESEKVKNTELTTNFSSNYGDWRESVFESYFIVNSALQGVIDSKIIDHGKVFDDVYCTEYSNGYKIFVNYSDSDIVTDDGIIPSRGFLVDQEVSGK